MAVTSEAVAFSSPSLSVCSGEGIAKLEVLKGAILLPSHNRCISGFHSVPQRQFIGSTSAGSSLIKVADAVVGPKLKQSLPAQEVLLFLLSRLS